MSKPIAGKLHQLLGRFSGYYWLAVTQTFYRPAFGAIGSRTRIIKPLKMRNMENIFIGSRVTIAKDAWLFTLSAIENCTPKLTIGDGCQIGNFNHITCVSTVSLGTKVLTADRVHISDNSHCYTNPDIAILDQPVISKGPVAIGSGTWLGENVSVLSCSIGRNCVIGANAVVTKDIPDFCVVAGIPGKILKRFDLNSNTWRAQTM
jgi:acetyltransferase-like isoleucine patch superfamily enzyme